MAFPVGGVLDSFTRGDQSPLGGTWSGKVFAADLDLSIITNRVGITTAVNRSQVWPTVGGAPQEAYAVVNATDGTEYVELWARLTGDGTAAPSGYYAEFGSLGGQDELKLFRVDAGVSTQLGATNTAHEFSANDQFGIECIGTTITLYSKVGAGAWTSRISVTDATYASGKLALRVRPAGTAMYVDDFGGTVGTAPATPAAAFANVRAFQEYEQPDAFQQRAFQRPDPARAFQEYRSQPEAFQPNAWQRPDWAQAFQDTAFDDEGFQEAADAFQDSAAQGDAFQQDERPVTAASTTTVSGLGQIASAEALGTTHVEFMVRNSGQIASAEAFGNTAKVIRIVANSGAIASGESFGTTKLQRLVRNVGAIGTAEAFGTTARVMLMVRNAGAISTGEAFGTTGRVRFIVGNLGAIGSAQAFGTTKTLRMVQQIGAIPTAEAFGSTQRVRFIVGNLGAIGSLEAFGVLHVIGGILNFSVSGLGQIPSAEAFGTTAVQRILRNLGAISSAQAFGNTARVLRLVGNLGGISTAETFGQPKLVRYVRNLGAIPTSETFGTTTLWRMVQRVGAIATAEALGQPKVRFIVQPVGVASAEAFGRPTSIGGIIVVVLSSVRGGVLVGDVLMFELRASDRDSFTANIDDRLTYEVRVSERERYGVKVDDRERFASAIADEPGG